MLLRRAPRDARVRLVRSALLGSGRVAESASRRLRTMRGRCTAPFPSRETVPLVGYWLKTLSVFPPELT